MNLSQMHCAPGGQATALSETEIAAYLDGFDGWERAGADSHEIRKTYAFKNYHETMAFVNATAWISHIQDHHPDIGLHYNRCVVSFSTHDAGGITLNDFICAAKMDALFSL